MPSTLQALAAKRVDDGLQDVLCLALFLDPSMMMIYREIVSWAL